VMATIAGIGCHAGLVWNVGGLTAAERNRVSGLLGRLRAGGIT